MQPKQRLSRIQPGTRAELADLEAKIVRKRGKVTPLYQYLLNSPVMAEGWEEFLSAVRQRNSLSPDLRELIILRVACLNRAPYEYQAHIEHAQKAGLSDLKIEAVKEEGISQVFHRKAERLRLTGTQSPAPSAWHRIVPAESS
ncbi:MAG: carboxymuconolactone decarboxylase family protein, partial [Synechococcus sp.]|nr:carboxymuconolactone decarboxylase family protein [Synechococcus sp.]